MRGKQRRDEPMFVHVRVEELVPKGHILRKIDRVIDFGMVEKVTAGLYSHTGRPSIDPEVLIRMLVVGYLNGITSERRLCEEVQVNLAYRWFCGLSLEDKVPDHSTFSKNRHGRFAESDVFRELFYEVVRQAQGAGLVKGRHLSVDASTVDADASMDSLEPIVVEMDPQAYVGHLEEQNPVAEKPKRSNETHRSKSDPDARIFRKKGGRTSLAYSHNVLMDNASRVVVDVEVTEPQYATEGEAAAEMIKRSRFKLGLKPETVGADKAYGTGPTLRRLYESGVEPHAPDPGRESWRQKGIFGKKHFEYDAQTDEMICPSSKRMRWNADLEERHITQYIAKASDCDGCKLKKQCTRARRRIVSRHWDQAYIDRAQQIRVSQAYRLSQRCRRQIESLFGEAKEQMGLRRARRRGLRNVTEQALMTAMVQNIKRIVAAGTTNRTISEPIAAAHAVVLDVSRKLMGMVLADPRYGYAVAGVCMN